MKPYQIKFEFTDYGYTVVVAENEEAAKQGALLLLKKRVKNPVVTEVTDAAEEQLDIPFPPTSTVN